MSFWDNIKKFTQPYADDDYDEYDEKVTWKTSTLRAWLNDEFMYEAFSQTERNLLVETTTTRNGAKDKVSLLSYSEAEKYFSK